MRLDIGASMELDVLPPGLSSREALAFARDVGLGFFGGREIG